MSAASIQQLICDQCGELIEQAEQGWVEWKSRVSPTVDQTRGYGLRIVHAHGYGPSAHGCLYQEVGGLLAAGEGVGDAALAEFLGDDGLMRILGKIVDRDLPLEELLELVKRTRMPNYEFARSHFADALAAGVLSHDVPAGYWPSADLERVIRWANAEGEDQAEAEDEATA